MEFSLGTVKTYLDSLGQTYEHSPDKDYVRTTYLGHNGMYSMILRVDEATQTFIIIIPQLARVLNTPDQAQALGKLLDLNYNLMLGSFDRDATDGEVRFRLTIPYNGNHITLEQFRRSLWSAYACVDQASNLLAGMGIVPGIPSA